LLIVFAIWGENLLAWLGIEPTTCDLSPQQVLPGDMWVGDKVKGLKIYWVFLISNSLFFYEEPERMKKNK